MVHTDCRKLQDKIMPPGADRKAANISTDTQNVIHMDKGKERGPPVDTAVTHTSLHTHHQN